MQLIDLPDWQAYRRWTPILLLHEVLPDSTSPLPPCAITRAAFRALLEDFSRRGYVSGTLDDLVAGPAQPKSNTSKRLIITFDDGTCDFLEHALPVLTEFQFSATLFIVAGMI